MSFKYSFPKSSRLLTAKDFFNISKGAQVYFGKFLKVYFVEKPYLSRKLGITVSKKYGKAHDRNRFKRLAREAFRLSQYKLPLHIQLNILPIHKNQNLSLEAIREDLLNFANRNLRSVDHKCSQSDA